MLHIISDAAAAALFKLFICKTNFLFPLSSPFPPLLLVLVLTFCVMYKLYYILVPRLYFVSLENSIKFNSIQFIPPTMHTNITKVKVMAINSRGVECPTYIKRSAPNRFQFRYMFSHLVLMNVLSVKKRAIGYKKGSEVKSVG